MKRNYFFLMIAAATLFASCEKTDEYAGSKNGGNPTPGDGYELRVIHLGNTVDNSTEYPEILDQHKAVLYPTGSTASVEAHKYRNEFRAIYDHTVSVEYGEVSSLLGKTFEIVDGVATMGKSKVSFRMEKKNNPELYFETNGRTYTYPELVCCKYTFVRVETENFLSEGNELQAKIIVLAEHFENGDTEELTLNGRFIPVEGDKKTFEYSDATIVSADEVEIIKTVKVNGSVVETSPIRVAYHATLECGGLISTDDLTPLVYGADANVTNGTANVVMNIVSFTASVDMPATVTFVDEGEDHMAKVVYDELYITSNGDITGVDNSTADEINILNTAYFKLVCDGIDMAEDDKLVRQTLRVYAEFEKEEDGTISFILHEKEDIRFTAPSGISIFSGNDDEFVVENLELSQTSRNQGSWNATETKTVNGVKFTSYSREDVYSYTHGITNTVKVTKNDDFIIVYNGHEYSVKINEVTVSAAAPVAGELSTDNVYKTRPYTLVYTASRNAVKSSDETVITLKKAVVPYTIEGYKLVRADQTDRYDSNRKIWNATPICAWFESLSDKNNTLFVAYDETTGAEIYRESTSGKTLPTMPLAMVYKNGTFVGGYVLIEENAYSYYSFDKSIFTAVSSVSTATSEEIRRSPYHGSGVYNNHFRTGKQLETYSQENQSPAPTASSDVIVKSEWSGHLNPKK